MVLGATNSSKGELSDMAIERLNTCYELFNKGDLILCTGGWGKHFNTTKKPYAFYANEYLLKKGVLHSDFLPFALSNNTVEDAVKIKEIVLTIQYDDLTIITSDFHLERVQLIFKEILDEFSINYLGVKNMLSKKNLEKVIKHEKNAIKTIEEKGLYY